jgi:hypothetical protein
MSHTSTASREPAPPGRRRTTTGMWAVIAVLLAIGIVVPLLVGLYDREEPSLGGFPFYYWFQFAMIPVVSVLTYTAFKLSQRATEKDRSVFGLPSEPGERTGGEHR